MEDMFALQDKFDKILSQDGLEKAKCKKCVIKYKLGFGTSNFIRHVNKCYGDDNRNVPFVHLPLDQDKYREMVAKLVIKHDCPFSFVEHKGFRDLVNFLNYEAHSISRNTLKADVLKLYSKEKDHLKHSLSLIPGRISITSDLWSSISTDEYMVVTTHYIDDEWNLQKKVLSFTHVPPPRTGALLAERLYGLLREWGIEKKIFLITLDNASYNDVLVNVLKKYPSLGCSLPCNGDFFHIRCGAHILNLIVQEGLKVIDHALHKIRESVNTNRLDCHYDATLILQITQMLDGCNLLVMEYRSVKEHVKSRNVNNLRMKLVRKRTSDARTYKLPTTSEDRRRKFSMILKGKKLTQQFSIDGFTMFEAQRVAFVRFHRKKLRSENYGTLKTALSNGHVSLASIGKRIILPSSFTGSQRYSRENFQDAMTICTTTSFPNLFITFTEFQKRGLQLAHILLLLASEDKLTTASEIDSIIFAEIPNANAHPELHEAVKSFMIHGPCGASRTTSPFMQNGKFSKHFPKKFSDRTLFDDDGYAKYRCRDTVIIVMKNGVELDNQFVVPYNPTLFRYQTHINIEFCNQSRSIKYLFKYVSKGYDKVTASLCNNHQHSEELQLDDDRLKDIALVEIESIMRTNRCSLREFHLMPLPSNGLLSNMDNMLMRKTFIWNTLTCALRSRGDIVLAVASSGIAFQLIPGRRTAHSRFAIPLDCNENSTCNIMQVSDLGNLLIHTKLIIWDEAPKAHRYCFEALDKTLRDICGKKNHEAQDKPFGGKVVVLTLTKNMRLGTCANETENRSISEFADWILKIGDGDNGDVINDEEKEITIPDDILVEYGIDLIHSIVNSTYPSFTEKFLNHEYIHDRAILAPTLDDVASINAYMLNS
ncbi:zinc finger BED domain-containing protein RICESLEEPER 2-like [Senna tora]|uniref:ATP-dependent DNA helicase n=1 Tax=Senna tora TaxID=362788 RepID=A0A835CE59_9FABA|nr:zinc finger BED domain-containing protein RICESLEEPER 2-like [Senna tora]